MALCHLLLRGSLPLQQLRFIIQDIELKLLQIFQQLLHAVFHGFHFLSFLFFQEFRFCDCLHRLCSLRFFLLLFGRLCLLCFLPLFGRLCLLCFCLGLLVGRLCLRCFLRGPSDEQNLRAELKNLGFSVDEVGF